MAKESTASEFTPTKNAREKEDKEKMKGRIEEVDDVASEPPVANESTASEFTPTKNAWKEEDKEKRMGRIEEVFGVASNPAGKAVRGVHGVQTPGLLCHGGITRHANESTASEFTPTKNAWEEEDKGSTLRRIQEVDDVASVTTAKIKWVGEDACRAKLIGEAQVLVS